jgi:hypothetical protein
VGSKAEYAQRAVNTGTSPRQLDAALLVRRLQRLFLTLELQSIARAPMAGVSNEL